MNILAMDSILVFGCFICKKTNNDHQFSLTFFLTTLLERPGTSLMLTEMLIIINRIMTKQGENIFSLCGSHDGYILKVATSLKRNIIRKLRSSIRLFIYILKYFQFYFLSKKMVVMAVVNDPVVFYLL